ncbi:MAG TPA: S41 family peptidase [Roseiflexaceae bacterium]|nr:S41 family peptidase [Roseiflexaceae bacterium]HMP40092.1 S41 family peptidase [Roseiflexaceae bacterium]
MKYFLISMLLACVLAACGTFPGLPGSATQPAAGETPPTVSPPTRTLPSVRTTAEPRPTAAARTTTAAPTPAAPVVTSLPILPTPTLVALDQAQREQIFNDIWSIVRDRYVYTDFRGRDWDAVRAEYAPQVATVDTERFYTLMKEMIFDLGDDHSRYDSPQDVADERARFEGDLRYVGIGALIRETDQGVLLLRIARNSPAERAGLQPFDLITHIDGIPVTDAERIGPGGPISRVRGLEGTIVTLTVRTGTSAPRDVDVLRGVIPSNAFPSVEATYLHDTQVGLLLIDTFSLNALDQLVRDAVNDLLEEGPLDGLVIDVRSNSGGRVDLLLETLAIFIDGGSIGTTSGRTRDNELFIPSGKTIAALDDVPIVVLTSEGTVSAGEMFAAGMQTLGRARVIGTPSAGNTENLLPHNFSDGSRLWLAELVYLLPDGTPIEGRGVVPDRIIDVEFWRFPTERDPQVLAAVEDLSAARSGSIQ